MSEQAVEIEHRITPLELFFDLVFVFAFTQVTTVISEDATWAGIGHGLLILAVLWWAWASYAWLTNTVDAGEDAVLAAMVGAMAAMVVAALAVRRRSAATVSSSACRFWWSPSCISRSTRSRRARNPNC